MDEKMQPLDLVAAKWRPTLHLRWNREDMAAHPSQSLLQLWIDGQGNQEWRAIGMIDHQWCYLSDVELHL